MAIKAAFDMVKEATAEIETISPADAIKRMNDEDFLLVDIRDPRELKREGRIPGAYHAPRGMLEFWIDPASPYYKPIFGEKKKFVFFCAAAGRSAISVKTLQDMGMENIAQLGEGFAGWREAGGPIEGGES
ncbi:rhodanese-like domain-containing protein [Pikeienuella sp. HZG-20]|uniref:rhodanese-like domain-containing protein n=1 Tax=Paludibacillus litoralis TaxID=3133267 RepID=UPI0030EC8C4F